MMRAGRWKSLKMAQQANAGSIVHVIELGNTRSEAVPKTQVAPNATARRPSSPATPPCGRAGRMNMSTIAIA